MIFCIMPTNKKLERPTWMTKRSGKAINWGMSQRVIGHYTKHLWFYKVLQSAHDPVHKIKIKELVFWWASTPNERFRLSTMQIA